MIPPYVHYCPHCHAMLSVNRLPVEKTASKCPTCQKYVILKEYGEVMLKPKIYICPKCNETHIYEDRPPIVLCDKCKTFFITSEQGQSLIEPELLSKGDKGELPYIKKKDRVVALRNKWRFLPTRHKVATFMGTAVMIASIIAAYIMSLPAAIETTKAYAAMDSIWTEFREKNPYNIQIEGIKAFDDNSYVVLLTEPSTNVDSMQLHDFFKKYNCAFKTNKTKIGYDGWLKDAIVCFNDVKPYKIQDLANKLLTILYGTDYKASFLDLDVIPQHTEYSEFNLNESVSEEELRQWFIEDKEKLVCSSDTTKESTLAELLAKEQPSDVYYSQQPGFVVWVIDKICSEETFRVCSRKFSLDSDLILGAISNTSRVAIIGRERCVPIYELPPMRVETLCLLVGTEKEELAQSYERTNILAGKLPGGKDFAPIYLSEELWHTEYGSILNITDQMLKSWSENGNIDYVDFKYTKPVNWAFDKGAVGDLGVSQLTYNWNTAGAGYIVEDEQYNIYALNRTGSLPVSYIPGDTDGIKENDKVYQAEQKAYDFFSYLSCPELVKVVQYVAMYQIFQNLNIKVKIEIPESEFYFPPEVEDIASATLNSLAHYGKEEMEKIASFYSCKLVPYGKGKYMFNKVYDINKTINSEKDGIELIKCLRLLEGAQLLRWGLDKVSFDNNLMESLSHFVLDQRNANISYTPILWKKKIPVFKDFSILSNGKIGGVEYQEEPMSEDEIGEEIGKIESLLLENGFIIQDYMETLRLSTRTKNLGLLVKANKENFNEWIKCPTVVLSWQLVDSAYATGGHNLDSKVTRFKVTKDAKTGKPIERNGKIEISARDRAAHISDQSYLRRVGRLNDVTIKGENVVTIRPRNNVVGIVSKRTARGFNSTDHSRIVVKADGTGYRIGNGEKISDITTFLDELSRYTSARAKGDVVRIELNGLNRAGVNHEVIIKGMRAEMRKGGACSIPLDRYDFANPSVKYEGEKAIVTIPIKAGYIQFGSTSNVIQAGMGGSTNISPKIHIEKGEVSYTIPKSKLVAFRYAINEFFKSAKGYMNELLFNNILQKFGINPNECKPKINIDIRVKEEMPKIMIATNLKQQIKYHYVSNIQEIFVA